MQKTPNYNLNKPEQTDVVNIDDLNANFDTLDTELKKVAEGTNLFKRAGGTGTAIISSDFDLEDGVHKTFIITTNNNGSGTTINGKPLYKPNTTQPPTLIAGKAVTVWYDDVKKCFFTAEDGNADTVNGRIVESDVPANAKFTDTVTSINGKTGAITKADITALGIPEQDTVYVHPSAHPPTILSNGSLPVGVTAVGSATDYGAARLRNIYAGTADLTPGVSALPSGYIYIVYE